MKRDLAIFIIWTVILLVLLLSPVDDIGTRVLGGFRFWDKIVHFVLFGITGVVVAYTSSFIRPVRGRIFFGLIFSLALGVATEGAQKILGFRTGSFSDLAADVMGVSLALLLYALLRLRE